MAASQLLALLCLGLIISVTEVTSQSRSSSDSEPPPRCSVPNWPADLGEDPVASNRGKVVLVALMKGYCSYCVGQATSLDRLKAHLYRYGIRDIAMVIVNGGEEISRERIANLESAGSLPVIQDTENHVMYSQVFKGNKDDFIVYDRCGQRSAWIPHPYSYLGHTITERILRAVHSGAHTCHCSLDHQPRDPHDVMYGDQPAGPGYGVVGTVTNDELDLECPHGDRWCRRYQRNFRRHNWDYRSNVHRARLSNRPRLQGNIRGEQEGRDYLANGQGSRHHHRQHESRNHGAGHTRIQFGSAPCDCTTVSLTPVIRQPTHRCRCPQQEVTLDCVCTRPVYDRQNNELSWHCGCHNPTPETRAQCHHCQQCSNRRVCREVSELARCQEHCRCQHLQNRGEDSSNSEAASAACQEGQGSEEACSTAVSTDCQCDNAAGGSCQCPDGQIRTCQCQDGQLTTGQCQDGQIGSCQCQNGDASDCQCQCQSEQVTGCQCHCQSEDVSNCQCHCPNNVSDCECQDGHRQVGRSACHFRTNGCQCQLGRRGRTSCQCRSGQTVRCCCSQEGQTRGCQCLGQNCCVGNRSGCCVESFNSLQCQNM